jgi:hypothetical protein
MNMSSSSKIGDFAFDAQRGKIKSGYMALQLFCNFQHAYHIIDLATSSAIIIFTHLSKNYFLVQEMKLMSAEDVRGNNL